MDKNTLDVNLDHFRELARTAYSFTSFDPDKRAENTLKEYGEELRNDLKEIRDKYPASVQRDPLDETLSRYRQKYESLFSSWLGSHSRLASSAVTGPANFPVARQQKYRSWEESKYKEFRDWRDRALKAITRRPKEHISELEEAKRKLADREELQRLMVSVNKVIRKGGANVNGQLKELGMSEEAIHEILTPDWANRTGYKSFELTNNNAEIRRLRSRVAMLEAKAILAKQDGEKIEDINGVKLIHNYLEDRVQVKFEGRPDQETLSKLNDRKFHWTPSKKIWQRKLTNNAIRDAENIVRGIKR
ncbi:hypothetical protein [Niabella beijingensis]|uniref:hypothetical protein n=1 Tax=Niabella beijingensis TaxID=2872700 RepID=UPI001CBEB73E|nr:hypothetical protein [Niabella beijingensis]MBZ4188890.1 hypothetical protein [Niabella beijingensis]